MTDADILQNIRRDLASGVGGAGLSVIYLEGKSDPAYFFALLGMPLPTDVKGLYVHQRTGVRGLKAEEKGSGNTMVREYLRVAEANGIGHRVFGLVDGDGLPYSQLVTSFDPPHAGPLFAWKAYSIESLVPQVPWNPAWGTAPNWVDELKVYAPYVALNRLHVRFINVLGTLRLAKYARPTQSDQLLLRADVLQQLQNDKALVTNFDVAAEFDAECQVYVAALDQSLEAGLALFDGKWLFSHFLVKRYGGTSTSWPGAWVSQAVASGGLPEVRDLWQRITGSPP